MKKTLIRRIAAPIVVGLLSVSAAVVPDAASAEAERVAVYEELPATSVVAQLEPTDPGADVLADQAPELPAPAPPAPVPPEPVEATEPGTAVEPEPVVEPEPAPEPEATGDATAINESRTVQVLVQVQRGCRSHCHGTSQTQLARQQATTRQDANATGGQQDGQALAGNSSRTLQFVWQAQLGCVAFCYGTSQVQAAGQSAQTTQSAEARGASTSALNESLTGQFAFQRQVGCRYECHGTAQSSSLEQQSSTTQNAEAWSEDDELAGLGSAFAELEAWARNTGSTFQFAVQFEDADCTRHCYGTAQSQSASQEAATVQHAEARVEGKAGPRLE